MDIKSSNACGIPLTLKWKKRYDFGEYSLPNYITEVEEHYHHDIQ